MTRLFVSSASHRPARRRLLALAAAAVALPGCALKSPPSPAELAEAELAHARRPPAWTAGGRSEPVTPGWLKSFDDPRLPPLAEEALAYNADLRIAAARVEIAAASLKAAGGAQLPEVNLAARTCASTRSRYGK